WSVEEVLHRLERRELMRRRRGSSVEGEPEYEFQHALIRDVAYSEIVRPARADRHVRAAEWIERLGDDHGDRADLLAHHYLTALARELAAGGDLETAAEAESDIGIWLDQHGEKEQGLGHLRRAVELLRDQPPSAAKASALTSLASVRVLDGQLDEAAGAAGEALYIAAGLGLDD